MRVSLLHNKEACDSVACYCKRVHAARMNLTWSPSFYRPREQELKSEKHSICLAGMIGINRWRDGERLPEVRADLLGRVHTECIANFFRTARLHWRSTRRHELTLHHVSWRRASLLRYWRGEHRASTAKKNLGIVTRQVLMLDAEAPVEIIKLFKQNCM